MPVLSEYLYGRNKKDYHYDTNVPFLHILMRFGNTDKIPPRDSVRTIKIVIFGPNAVLGNAAQTRTVPYITIESCV